MKNIVRMALLTVSERVVLVHNHPSNSLIPSKEDIYLTNYTSKILKIFNIKDYTNTELKALLKKDNILEEYYDEWSKVDGNFNAENVVLFGYSFVWTMLEELKINLARLKDTEKNLRINFDVRY